MKKRLNQFRSGGAAFGFLIAYYQVGAGIVPEGDLLLVGGAFATLSSGLADYLHGILLENDTE
jgi:hypothetical protein